MFAFSASNQAIRRGTPQGRYHLGVVLAAVMLATLGVIMVASSSIAIADNQNAKPFYYLFRHLVFLGLGLGLAILVARTELAKIEQHAFLLLLIGLILLLLVFVPGIGMRVNGARRWINVGISGFQSVELVKLILIVYLASYLVRHREGVQASMWGVCKPIGIAALLVGLLLMQPDFGSAALLIMITLGMVWLGGARLRNLGLLAALAMPALAWAALFEEYRLKRLKSFLDPWADPFNEGFQLTQALIAVGRGEWFGVGLGASVQKLFYLPEAHTDFILAVIAEELGFFGVLLVIALFAWLVGCGLRIGLRALERGQRFGGYCAFGVSLMLAIQALVSIGVNLGVLPTKGLTLPLISSGGSSVLMTCAAIGLLARVSYELTRAEDAAAQAVSSPESPGEAE
ncbi:MAG: putative lipid II flippase FtsW [Dokdonella sp.]|jgi:cell division protein FtsW|uniref:putative lipid II flippase FtsW n=1 Tax=Dokdonella sp. TaxID=2291710 RepID=UPI001B76BDEC|nr:putative lipid II flippase FtsW [Dokdonella sp.]MBK8124430.1 putative lipid II flippase FtsW [Dokdonella sp.]MBP6325713.1 putative lipid II flippase FtsW [Dokdonella sp.]MBP6329025.1 putative lipid II flippase FtsW [Dokdonella sp.]HNV07289.1 putative lipid II flippase FtsW [Dokdonella sp.]HPW02572.1 putative lipid II flippase FtsW [Dokdonella sp.]